MQLPDRARWQHSRLLPSAFVPQQQGTSPGREPWPYWPDKPRSFNPQYEQVEKKKGQKWGKEGGREARRWGDREGRKGGREGSMEGGRGGREGGREATDFLSINGTLLRQDWWWSYSHGTLSTSVLYISYDRNTRNTRTKVQENSLRIKSQPVYSLTVYSQPFVYSFNEHFQNTHTVLGILLGIGEQNWKVTALYNLSFMRIGK